MKGRGMLATAVLLICLLSGCAGLALLGLIFKLVAAGAIYLTVRDFLGREASDFTLYFDGYNTGQHPNPDGRLSLEGMPAGHHLLTLADTSATAGFHQHVYITAGGRIDLGSITPIQGGTISGYVRRRSGSSWVPLAGVRVAAFFGGGELLKSGAGASLRLPPESDVPVVMMDFTDAEGRYRLGPAQYGAWLVTAAYPGYLADVALVNVSGGQSPDNVALQLEPDNMASVPPTVRGAVLNNSGRVLAQALVMLRLSTPFAPNVPSVRVQTLEEQIGSPLRAQPWIAWTSLATVTDQTGAYTLIGLPGAHHLAAFYYGYQAQEAEITLQAGQALAVEDFRLPLR